jgi:polyisoprenoid-binding protein YceI
VSGFDASNRKMLSDFHEMVSANEYPNIHIEIEPGKFADFDETSGRTRFKSKITIAGTTNEYIIPSEISSCQIAGYMLKGNLMVKLTDFGIEPPRKVLGAVKVNDEVFINFAFRIPAEGLLTEDIP